MDDGWMMVMNLDELVAKRFLGFPSVLCIFLYLWALRVFSFVCVCLSVCCVFMHDFPASVKPPTAPIRQQEWQIKPADSVQVAVADGEEITL